MKKIMILALLTLFAIPTYSVLAAESPASNNGNYGGCPGWQYQNQNNN